MAPKKPILDEMRAKPHDDWRIEDVQKVCRQCGLACRKPNGGSHYIVSSKFLDFHLSVPRNRPIKVIYIERLVGLIDAHQEAEKKIHGGTR